MQAVDLEENQLFMFDYDRNAIYRVAGFQCHEDNSVSNVVIQRVAFRFAENRARWIFCTEQHEEWCNPYANVLPALDVLEAVSTAA